MVNKMNLTMKNTKAELYSALKNTNEVYQERNILAWICFILFAVNCLF